MDVAFELRAIQEQARIHASLSSNCPVSLGDFKKLAVEVLNQDGLSASTRMALLSQYGVAQARYQNSPEDALFLNETSLELIKSLKSLAKDSSLLNQLRQAVAYRGLAMVSSFSVQERSDFMLKSLKLSEAVSSTSELEKRVIRENLYTTCQSFAKWELFHHRDASAENFLEKMIELDPCDSTGYSELGLFFYQRKGYSKAAALFEKAATLGPPALGMNRYYQGLCAAELGLREEARELWQKAIECDPYAVSPWLEIFEQSRELNQLDQAKKTAEIILENFHLREQLDLNEVENLRTISLYPVAGTFAPSSLR